MDGTEMMGIQQITEPTFESKESSLSMDLSSTANGLYMNSHYIPEEILLQILSLLPLEELPGHARVCKLWNNLIKSTNLWKIIYKRKYKLPTKNVPWYAYYALLTTDFFDSNLLRNGNGQDKFKHWKIILDGGDRFIVENPPNGSDCLSVDIADFSNHTSCFATSFFTSSKQQKIVLNKRGIFTKILNECQPKIVISEWIAGRWDCGCKYKLTVKLLNGACNKVLAKETVSEVIEQWSGRPWFKKEVVFSEYPKGVENLYFRHEGQDTKFWAGHYGVKMAGGVVKVLFESILEDHFEIDDS